MGRKKSALNDTFIDPSEWIEVKENLILLEGWARDGYTYRDIAEKIGISTKMLTKWRTEIPEIKNALNKGREVVDYKVESAILKAALGYKTKEVTIISVLKQGKMVEVQKQVVTKEVSPNVSACTTWLYNRLPKKWKNMNVRSNILEDLADEDSNISITVTRASKDNLNPTSEGNNSNPSDNELESNNSNSQLENNFSVNESNSSNIQVNNQNNNNQTNQTTNQEELEDKEWQESVNQSIMIRRKTEEEKKKEKAEKRKQKRLEKARAKEAKPTSKLNLNLSKEDLDYWPDDWEDDES